MKSHTETFNENLDDLPRLRRKLDFATNLVLILLVSLSGAIITISYRLLVQFVRSLFVVTKKEENESQSKQSSDKSEPAACSASPSPSTRPMNRVHSDPRPFNRHLVTTTTHTSVRVTQTSVSQMQQETVVSVSTQISSTTFDVQTSIKTTTEIPSHPVFPISSEPCFWRPWFELAHDARFGYKEVKGGRAHMENRVAFCADFHTKSNSQRPQSCAVLLDGHAGVEAAEWVQSKLFDLVANHVREAENICESLQEAFLDIDQQYCEWALSQHVMAGAVGVFVLIEEDKLYVANVGDCKAVLCVNGKDLELTEEHHSKCDKERLRVLESFPENGESVWDQLTRNIEVTRAFGDLHNGSKLCGLTAQPFVKEYDLDSDAEFLVLGCDGFWDGYAAAKTAIADCRRKLRSDPNPQLAAEYVVNVASARSDDNISALVVAFPKRDPKAQCGIRVGPAKTSMLRGSRLRRRRSTGTR